MKENNENHINDKKSLCLRVPIKKGNLWISAVITKPCLAIICIIPITAQWHSSFLMWFVLTVNIISINKGKSHWFSGPSLSISTSTFIYCKTQKYRKTARGYGLQNLKNWMSCKPLSFSFKCYLLKTEAFLRSESWWSGSLLPNFKPHQELLFGQKHLV